MPAVSPLATALEFTADAPETLVNNVQPISRQESAGVSAPAAAPARAKSRPAPAPNAFASLAGGIMESVAAMTRTPEQDVFERNPVRLDMLFTTIGK
nr:hypothetical protein [uncultured Enterobacter sp.]